MSTHPKMQRSQPMSSSFPQPDGNFHNQMENGKGRSQPSFSMPFYGHPDQGDQSSWGDSQRFFSEGELRLERREATGWAFQMGQTDGYSHREALESQHMRGGHWNRQERDTGGSWENSSLSGSLRILHGGMDSEARGGETDGMGTDNKLPEARPRGTVLPI